MTKSKAWKLYESLKKEGLSLEKEQRILEELKFKGKHKILDYPPLWSLEATGQVFSYLKELYPYLVKKRGLYQFNDMLEWTFGGRVKL
jgi:hypothetical protein